MVDLVVVYAIVEEVVVVAMVVVIITIEPGRGNSNRSSSSSVRLKGERSPYAEWSDAAIAVMGVVVVIVA